MLEILRIGQEQHKDLDKVGTVCKRCFQLSTYQSGKALPGTVNKGKLAIQQFL